VFRVRTRVVPCLAGSAVVAAAGLVAAVPATAHSLGSRTLRQGTNGSDVQQLQAGLSQAGFDTASSGKFTSETSSDLKRFQRFYRLKATGVADAHTVAVVRQVDKMDADATDTQTSGGSGLSGSKTVKVKARRSHAKRGVTNDPSKLISSNPVMAPVKRNGGSAHLGNRILRPGMHGHDVRVLQAYLTLDGFPTTVDGAFGPGTKANVVAWQSANNVADNGVFSYADSRKLRTDVAKVESSPKSKSSTTVGTTSGPTATIDSDGNALAPADAPQAVKTMIAAANRIDTKPYIYAGGHASWNAPGYDCSGATGYVLHAAGFLNSPLPSGAMEDLWQSGKGHWVTVYASGPHAFIVIAGLAFDTAHYGPTTPGGSGPRWLTKANATANLSDGNSWVARHPAGL
jgi:peptidoglycan hydrolase-like protein with peptidoglycan-binding domain